MDIELPEIEKQAEESEDNLMIEAVENKEELVIKTVASLPIVKIDRDKFLKKELCKSGKDYPRRFCQA